MYSLSDSVSPLIVLGIMCITTRNADAPICDDPSSDDPSTAARGSSDSSVFSVAALEAWFATSITITALLT